MNDIDFLNAKIEALERRVAELERGKVNAVPYMPPGWHTKPIYPSGAPFKDTQTSNSADALNDVIMLTCMM